MYSVDPAGYSTGAVGGTVPPVSGIRALGPSIPVPVIAGTSSQVVRPAIPEQGLIGGWKAREVALLSAGPENLPIAETIRKFQQELATVSNVALTEEVKVASFLRRLQPYLCSYVSGL
jgi:hypothetical protein